jgi:uncharacterized protein with FMN-binding domain
VRKVALVVAATIAGLALVLGYRPHSQARAVKPPAVSLSPAAQAGPVTQSSPVTAVGSDQSLGGGLGDLEVKVTVAGGRIVKVGLAKLTLNGPQSSAISDSVLPQLEQQTMAAQSSAIQGVSGATYTSQAYAISLQSALDKAAAQGGSVSGS